MALTRVRRAFVILLAIVAVVILGLMFAQDQETLRIRSQFVATDPAHPEYLAALSGADPTRGNQYDVLTNGDQIFPAMLAAIDGARQRISFETYIYDTGEVANRFTEALEKAARRGVQVRLLTDSVGSSGMTIADVDRLRSAGCQVISYNPPHWYRLESVNYRTHRKILVVDGQVGFTGGVGVADHWLGHAQDKDHWRDTQVRLRGPIVRLLEASFYEDFVESTGPITPELDPAPALRDEEGASFVVRSSPTGGSSDLKRLYLLIIASAQKTLDITSPYFVTDESSLWSLEDAVRRGVTIRILVEGDITDAMPVKYASRAVYDRLLAIGIQISEYQPTMMHTKVLVADGMISMFGSANFDNRSLELNDELNVAVWNRDLAARFTQDLEADLQRARKLELQTWRRRSLLDKTREQFWSYFGEIF
ncbi:MAG TPA: phospholipase D-like domain-containing protein [Vicinamibacterales bacterium]|nr:phospholipase D-like domain-containing protein [Vicinamibacterales bacterium]